MISAQTIIKSISEGLKHCSETYGIEPINTRMRLKSDMGVYVYDGKLPKVQDGKLVKVDLKTVFGVSPLLVTPFLKTKLKAVAKSNNIAYENASILFCSVDNDFNTSAKIMDGGKVNLTTTINDIL